MKKANKFFAILIVVALSYLLSVPAFAIEQKTVVEVDGSNIVDYSDVLPSIYGEDFLCRGRML